MNRLKTAAALLLLAIGLGLLGACTPSTVANLLDGERNGAIRKIKAHNQAGYDLMEEGRYAEAIAEFERAIAYVYEYEPAYMELTGEVRASETLDAPFNNMSWAYQETGDFAKSLEYIEIALLLLPNSDVEYVNKGNALYGLGQYEEAMVQYDKAIDMNKSSLSAYYGKGMIHYDRGQYKEALDAFNAYLRQDESDIDAMEMKVYAHLGLGETEKALSYADYIIGKNPRTYAAHMLKSIVLEQSDDSGEAETFYRELAAAFPDVPEAQERLGAFYYNKGEYDKARDYFRERLAAAPGDSGSYVWLIQVYGASGDYEAAERVYAEAAEEAEEAGAAVAAAMGDMLVNRGRYADAAAYYDNAAALEPDNERHYSSKLLALYNGNRNERCTAFGREAAERFPDSSDIAWYAGLCGMELGQYEDAVRHLTRAAETDPGYAEGWAQLAYVHLMLGEERKAEEYSDRSLELYPDNYTAAYVKGALEEKRRPLGAQIKSFFIDNYLYQDHLADPDSALSELDRTALTPGEIAAIIERAKKKDDMFTFMVYGEQYDELTALEESDLEITEEGELIYVRIPTFHVRTDDAFIAAADEIANPERKTLVLDLRGNSGGLADSANGMLDALLPDYVASMMIYRDGQTESYYSDPSFIQFRHIYILVDGNTASAAELLTLSLRSYLNNVTVVGRDTYGKGVGQYVFEDKRSKVLLYLVHFYWNVKQSNIADTGIKPDIYVQGDDLQSFMKPARERL